MDKNKISSENKRRHLARASFRAHVERAQIDLHPRMLADKWKQRQLVKIVAATGKARKIARKNALLIGMAGVGALFFTARGPILNMVHKFRAKPTPTPTEQDPQ